MNAFAAEKTNIAVKDSITVKRSPPSGWPCTEFEPGKGAVFPAPGYVNASSIVTIMCILKYMGQMAAWRIRKWASVRAFLAVMLTRKDW